MSPNNRIEITNIACNRSKQTLDTPASGAEGSVVYAIQCPEPGLCIWDLSGMEPCPLISVCLSCPENIVFCGSHMFCHHKSRNVMGATFRVVRKTHIFTLFVAFVIWILYEGERSPRDDLPWKLSEKGTLGFIINYSLVLDYVPPGDDVGWCT